MLDSIVFEQQGVPSASIITDVFKPTGRAMARTWGLPDFKFIAIPHPIANLTDAQLDRHLLNGRETRQYQDKLDGKLRVIFGELGLLK